MRSHPIPYGIIITKIIIIKQDKINQRIFIEHLQSSKYWVYKSDYIGLNCVSSKFTDWNPNSQYLRMWLNLETGTAFKEETKVKGGHIGGL